MRETSSSLTRMLALLDAFSPAKYAWAVDELAAHFDYTPSSTYRYVKELCKSGLLLRLPGGIYVIGARVIELETLTRETDPVLRMCQPLLRELVRETTCHALLSNVYGDHLINITYERGDETLEPSYVRGRSLPWFRGSPSMAVLPFLAKTKVRHLFDATFGAEATDTDWQAMWARLKAIRKAGYCVSEGELDPGVFGFGVPVIVEGEVLGSISLACSTQRAAFLNRDMIGLALKDCSTKIAHVLANASHSTPADQT